MKLSEIETTLREIRVSPVKTMGQNFLHDHNLSRWIVEKADLSPDDYVVELGPGLGALTEFILETGARVLAIEKDQRLATYLRTRFPTDRLEVLHQDALDYDLRQLLTKSRVKLLGNLPYNIASQLLLKYTRYPSPISLWLLMLQKELARRLSAHPRTHDYGALTLTIRLHYTVEYLRTVPATVFLPRPDVDSAYVRISPCAPGKVPSHDPNLFLQLVRLGFSQRRKQLRNLLREHVRDWKLAAQSLGFESRARAEELTLEQWIGLVNLAGLGQTASGVQGNEELLSIVDTQDRVQGAATRAEVHGNNLRHRAVHMFVFNRSGDLFLQKRSGWKDRHPLLWDSSAAGHVPAGEDYDRAALRELKEELGISAPLTRELKLPASEETGEEFIWLYRASHDGPFQMPGSEIEHGEFFPPALVSEWLKARPTDFAPGFIACWSSYKKKSKARQNTPNATFPEARGC